MACMGKELTVTLGDGLEVCSQCYNRFGGAQSASLRTRGCSISRTSLLKSRLTSATQALHRTFTR